MGGLPTSQTVNGFAVDAENPRTMYVAMKDGLFKSTDGGLTWKGSRNVLKNLAAVSVNPKNPKEIYAAATDGTIFMSADAGMNWKKQ